MLALQSQLRCWNNFTDSPLSLTEHDFSLRVKEGLDVPEHLRFVINLSTAVKAVEEYKRNKDALGNDISLEEYILFNSWLSCEQIEALFDYKDLLKVRISNDSHICKYSRYLLDLVDQWKLHDYVFIWEWGYGKVILIIDYSKTPTTATIIKLWKNSIQRVWWVWNLIEEAELQKKFQRFINNYKQEEDSNIEIWIPQLYEEWREISSRPEQWYLVMEYTHAETIESLLLIADNYEKVFSNITRFITSLLKIEDPYIKETIIPRYESMWVDYKRAKNSTLVRLLNKTDIIYILKKLGKNISWKEYKKKFDKSLLRKAITAFFKLNRECPTNIEWITVQAYKAYQDFLESAKKSQCTHNDLNTSNIMIDYKNWKLKLWLIDFWTTH